jgi:hypothetical protein
LLPGQPLGLGQPGKGLGLAHGGEVRRRLNDPSLYPLFDSMDICQSVLASFFLRAAAGEYDLDGPAQLLRLLVGIARNGGSVADRQTVIRVAGLLVG